jgi:hypothetical protein
VTIWFPAITSTGRHIRDDWESQNARRKCTVIYLFQRGRKAKKKKEEEKRVKMEEQ